MIRRSALLSFPIAALLLLLSAAQESPLELPKPKANSAQEPLAGKLSLARSAEFLDAVSLHWTRARKCGTCHTNLPYLMARPALKEIRSPAADEIRRFFETRVAGWEAAKQKQDTEVVATAATLAIHDAQTTGKLHPLTRQALDRMWTLQKANGAWNWAKCGWPPFEHDDYYGAVFAAVGVGHAPEGYAAGESARAGLAKLREYFQKTSAPTLHHKTWLLWASVRLEGLLSREMREELIRELLALEKADGGWSLPSLGDWKAHDDDHRIDPNAPSDGYGTGFVVYVLRQAGLAAEHPALRKGVAWLGANQRESGRWFTRSLNNDKTHFIANAGTAFAVLALKACE
jgi:squalene-hopene/tetraprenyl-beta-curcumene cyclase